MTLRAEFTGSLVVPYVSFKILIAKQSLKLFTNAIFIKENHWMFSFGKCLTIALKRSTNWTLNSRVNSGIFYHADAVS